MKGMIAELSARLEDCDADEEASPTWAGCTASAVVELLVGDSVVLEPAVGRLVGASLGSYAAGLFCVGEVILLSVVGMLSVGALNVFPFVGPSVAASLMVFSNVGKKVAAVVLFSAVGDCVAGRTLFVLVGILAGA